MIDFPGERLEELDIYAVGEVDMKGVAMMTVYCRSVCSISIFIHLTFDFSVGSKVLGSVDVSFDLSSGLSMWERLWAGKKWSRLDDCEDNCDNASDDKDLLTYADIFLHILTSPYLF